MMEYRIWVISHSVWHVDSDGFVFETEDREKAEEHLEIFKNGTAKIVEIKQ